MLKFDELPSVPLNDRIMVLPDQPKERTDGGIVIPDVAMRVGTQAKLIDAGLRARDILHDNGDQIGDTVLFGQFAGVWEEWDHIITAGKDPSCAHDWAHDHTLAGFRRQGLKCVDCGAQRLQEPVLVMNVGDILANVSKAERIRSGELVLKRATSFDGKTTHVYLRRDEITAAQDSTTPTNGVTHVA